MNEQLDVQKKRPLLAHSGQFHPYVLPSAFIGSYVAFESSAGASLSAILAQQTRRAYTVWGYLLSNAKTTIRLPNFLDKSHHYQSNIEKCLIKSAHACIPLARARLILSTHSLNAFSCSVESSDSSILTRRTLRERSISFLINRKQITLTQRGENLLRPIALVI